MFFLAKLAQRLIRDGDLHVEDSGGRAWRFGDGNAPRIRVKFRSRLLPWQMLARPEMSFLEAYMDGRIELQEGSLRELLELMLANLRRHGSHGMTRKPPLLRRLTGRLRAHNPIGRARRNVRHHYDLDGGLYDLFLDADKQYSCAYFPDPQMGLDEAQAAKKRHIAAKLLVRPGQSVLDIGCGWGGLALYLARRCGARVVGITLSRAQHDIAAKRAREAGLEGQVEIRMQDYREVKESFDRIVSVGMFEHVGVRHYGEFFDAVENRLREDGVALLHTIGRMGVPWPTHPWIHKYIFPGGALPALSEIIPHIERRGLFAGDIEVLRMHYAYTLEHWLARFQANRDKAAQLYDERFCRMWEIYLIACIHAFRYEGLCNFQIQMAKRLESVPICRDYIQEWERGEESVDAVAGGGV